MEDDLVRATWGLVVVTGLLVVVSGLEFVRGLQQRRSERAQFAVKAVPDMNILRSRLEGAWQRLENPGRLDREEVEDQAEDCDEELGMLVPLVELREASLQFTNEIFIVRHLLTFARDSLNAAADLFGTTGEASIRQRDEELRKAQRAYRAALLSLDAAEELLPENERTIRGERFWDRFARVSDERENRAAALLVAEREERRTRERRS